MQRPFWIHDVTSTYFESDPPFADKRQFGHSRDQRRDCVQVVIALVVTPDGFPLAYEVMPGNTSDNTTLSDFLTKIALCVMLKDSFALSVSFRARTVTVWAVFQLPLLPSVKVSVAVLPNESPLALTCAADGSPEVAVTVTVAPGSVSSTTV